MSPTLHQLLAALTALRNQLTVKHDEDPVSAADDRLLLVQSWMRSAPAAQDLFEIWEQINMACLFPFAISMFILTSTFYSDN